MKKCFKFCFCIIFLFLFVYLFLKIDFKNYNSKIISNKNIINGTYVEDVNKFVTLSFDFNTKEYFYYDISKNDRGNFIYLNNGKYKIISGKLENYIIKVIDFKTIQIYNDNISRVFLRESNIPTIINE